MSPPKNLTVCAGDLHDPGAERPGRGGRAAAADCRRQLRPDHHRRAAVCQHTG